MPVDGAILQNRYLILRLLSDKGGMGVVYQAKDERLDSTVVVKETKYLQLKPEVRDIVLKAFYREARLLANLRHDALPRVTDYFTEGDGHFLVMEYIPGKDLEELLLERGAPFSLEQVVRWADSLLVVLEYLHGHAEPVIHRDIKPANLKLTPKGGLMLLDFGLAKGAAAGIQPASSVFGYTKQYASLEQIKGKGTNVRSDLFSLGATLYHLLTGKMPLDAVERVSEVAIGNPDPLKTVAELNPLVPANISAIISRTMSLKPDDRPVTAGALRQILRECLQWPQIHSTTTLTEESETVAESYPATQIGSPMKPVPVHSFTEDVHGVRLEMIYVPGGRFKMGSPEGTGHDREKPQHDVTVPAFYIGKFPLTQAQWKAVMGDKLKPYFKGDSLPMEMISWDDATEFCQELSQVTGKTYRLPSEAEWEYACRAGTPTEFAFGDSLSSERANFNDNLAHSSPAKGVYRQKTTPVGSFAPNAFGVYDMHGNVWEWCEDVWHGNYNGAPTNSLAWASGGEQVFRVLRGGSWDSQAALCRSAFRYVNLPGNRVSVFGFRVAFSPQSS